ncbi:hypothetical protein L4Z93_000914 [Pseudomonas aeruginosa]|nr:hypothetical protein [Pseudomonas aeruginosa]
MPVFEVVSGGDRRSLMKRFERKSKQQAISELVDFHLLNCDRIEKLEAERDAALARVAELEKQEPVALANRGNQAFWVKWTEAAAGLYGPGIKLYAAPVAQAQQLNDLDKQCRDDVARALGLRPNQERGFAWSYLLASIKSCVKASEDSAQAQHSVPEVFREKFEQCMKLAFAEIAQYVSPENARDPQSRARRATALATELRAMLAAAPAQGGE